MKFMILPASGLCVIRKLLIASMLAVMCAVAAQAMEGGAVEMTLEQCLDAALANSPDIKIETLNLVVDEKEITAADAQFDPDMSAEFSYGDSKRPNASTVTGSRRKTTEKTTEFTLGYGGERMDGDSYSLELSQVKLDTDSAYSAVNPSYTLDLSLSYTQPLGRGRGRDATLSWLRITKLNRDITELGLKDEMMDLVYDVESAYWNLVYAEKALEARRESMALAEETLDRTSGMIEAGALPESQVLLVESQLASRREDVISAEGDLSRAALDLKLAMRIATGSDLWERDITPAGPGVDKLEIEMMPFADGLEKALAGRPDYLELRKELEAAGIRVESARDDVKPDLDLEATVGVGGLKDNYTRSLQDISSLEYPSWSVGLWWETPAGRREARARLDQRVMDEKSARLEIEKAEQDIAAEIAGAQISLKTAGNRVDAAAVARDYAEKKLKEEEEKHILGIATTHDVLEYQEDLAVARMNECSAIVDYNIAVADYYLALGTILEEKGLKVSGPEYGAGR